MTQNQEKQKSKENDPKITKILELTEKKYEIAIKNMCKKLKEKIGK